MNGPRWPAEDLHTIAVSTPDRYASSTERPVRCAEASDGDAVRPPASAGKAAGIAADLLT